MSMSITFLVTLSFVIATIAAITCVVSACVLSSQISKRHEAYKSKITPLDSAIPLRRATIVPDSPTKSQLHSLRTTVSHRRYAA